MEFDYCEYCIYNQNNVCIKKYETENTLFCKNFKMNEYFYIKNFFNRINKKNKEKKYYD